MTGYWDELEHRLEVRESRESYYQRNVLLRKSFEFGLRIIAFHAVLKKGGHQEIASQLLRSGTSIGANANEATAAESKRDFVHRIAVAAKEAREAHYWLLLIHKSSVILAECEDLMLQAEELVKITTAIVKTCRTNH